MSAVSLLLDLTILEGRHPALLAALLPDTDGVTREGRLDKGMNSLAPPRMVSVCWHPSRRDAAGSPVTVSAQEGRADAWSVPSCPRSGASPECFTLSRSHALTFSCKKGKVLLPSA